MDEDEEEEGNEEDSDEDEDDEEEEAEDEAEDEASDLVAAPVVMDAGTRDPVVAALLARAKRDGTPSLEEARKQVRAVVHNYIVETGRTPTNSSG
jgi:hypothetical protein